MCPQEIAAAKFVEIFTLIILVFNFEFFFTQNIFGRLQGSIDESMFSLTNLARTFKITLHFVFRIINILF